MSAIAGIINFNKEPINRDYSLNMMKALEKFPADDIRVFQKDNAFLGCHAQWITPESIGEPLPFYDSERQCAITADAIIDNRDELFEKLQVDRTKRKTMPDSQLILLAYYKWGEESPKHLVGDFAFMIWDEREQKLFGARDFSGARMLYYFKNQHHIAFSTTIKPLLTLPYIKKELNEQWLAEFLAIVGMIDVADASQTVYKNIDQVPPSHSFTIVNGKVNFKQYCTLVSEGKLKLKSDDEYIEAFQHVFQQAVSSRLRTHRGIGAQLSGGLDSGSIVSFAVKELRKEGKQLHTFSYIPPRDFYDFTPPQLLPDETPLIKATVKHVGGISDHYCDFEGRDSYTEIDSFLEMMEMPYKFFENSFWLKGMFEKAQEKGMGVLLNGGRGNMSISWGSAMDYYALLLKRLQWIRLAKELNQYSRNVGGNRLRRLPYISRVAFPIIDKVFPTANHYEFPPLINPDFADRTQVFTKLKDFGMDESGWFSSNSIFKQRKSHFEEVFHWNASNTLAAKSSLMHSVWKRDPSNDIRVIRYCLSLPEDQYVHNGLDRALIRRATKGYLPDQIRLNQRVRGVQGADWVHRMAPKWDDFRKEVQQLKNNSVLLELIDKKVINESLTKVGDRANAVHATDPHYKMLMRSIIVSRYIKKFT
ncbi:lasso peptide isopeptide bond-forming cyclase [Mesobacillus foraminis]|uniref:lasso peptide isopeptide bond-forming cyclase n=1 Tax=Mesobacillus foraminis TaxID=279826 RepID=UPI000EF54216|nr:lasso peptide isopeptide bond-forming cyclase [Mesobacillus foraminis]